MVTLSGKKCRFSHQLALVYRLKCMQALSWYFTTCSVYTILGKKIFKCGNLKIKKKKKRKRKLEAGHTKWSRIWTKMLQPPKEMGPRLSLLTTYMCCFQLSILIILLRASLHKDGGPQVAYPGAQPAHRHVGQRLQIFGYFTLPLVINHGLLG